ncbi:hypothetical protein E2C01_053373 [Portunus trituberculatus]|uniref:Uncharacterized protein n=1 Tax=Portunus trituberculatus TaxID=210409 RepID=A0A5B7GPA9_PORTR|nr:hypothetical protein [Portunus trituberculatus]
MDFMRGGEKARRVILTSLKRPRRKAVLQCSVPGNRGALYANGGLEREGSRRLTAETKCQA